MHEAQRMVEEFHRATGATIGDTPQVRDASLRADLILEEAAEFADALGVLDTNQGMGYTVIPYVDNWRHADLVKAIDALCDLLYVVYGTAVSFGIDLEPFFAEVHASNLTKVGGPVRPDGKRLKPKGYQPPNLVPILEAQRANQ